jgi:hypothetical protein
MKVRLVLAGLSDPLDWCPVHAVVSPYRLGFMRMIPYQPIFLPVKTAHLSTNFSPPVPHIWVFWDPEKHGGSG